MNDPYPPTPELEKLKAVAAKSQVCGEFLEWLLEEQGFVLAKIHKHTDECRTMGFSPEEFRKNYEKHTLASAQELAKGRFNTPQCGYRENDTVMANYNVTKLLGQFFEINMDKVENEKRAILDWQRRRNAERK